MNLLLLNRGENINILFLLSLFSWLILYCISRATFIDISLQSFDQSSLFLPLARISDLTFPLYFSLSSIHWSCNYRRSSFAFYSIWNLCFSFATTLYNHDFSDILVINRISKILFWQKIKNIEVHKMSNELSRFIWVVRRIHSIFAPFSYIFSE